jgi:redox-sensitive bicupin YhaK (pirin superfamily)
MQVKICGFSSAYAFESSRLAHLVILSGAEIREPVVTHGSFIMNEQSQIETTFARFRMAEMGHLAPLSEIERD